MAQGVTEQMICWIDGKIVPASEARIPVLDHGFLFGDGVFEGIRVTSRGIFRFADHMKRLETAAQRVLRRNRAIHASWTKKGVLFTETHGVTPGALARR